MNESPNTALRLFGLNWWQWLIVFLPTVAVAIVYPVSYAFFRAELASHPPTYQDAGFHALLLSAMVFYVATLVPAVVFSFREKRWPLRILGIPVWWGVFAMVNGFLAMLGFGIIDGFTK